MLQGKGYDLADPAVNGYFGDLLARPLGDGTGPGADAGEPWRGGGPTYSDPRLTPQRPGQQAAADRLDNGLLLRSDVHTRYDRGYLGVDPRYRLLVSPRLRADFSNGDQFYAKAGLVIDLPERRADRPGREFLEWHLDEIFLKAAAT